MPTAWNETTILGHNGVGGRPMPTTVLDLNDRRKALKMPVEALVKRSGVPRAAVVRILRGKAERIRFGQFEKVAEVLGIPFGAVALDPQELRNREARRKAKLLRRLTQGTMGLESQALPEEVLREIEERTVAKLLAGTGRKLWSD